MGRVRLEPPYRLPHNGALLEPLLYFLEEGRRRGVRKKGRRKKGEEKGGRSKPLLVFYATSIVAHTKDPMVLYMIA